MDMQIIQDQLGNIISILPKVLVGILFIIVCWIVLRIILFIVKKSLKLTKIDSFFERMNDSENPIFSLPIKIDPTKVILIFVKWFLILVFIIIGADILELNMVSNEVSKIVQYLPKIFMAAIIFFIGTYGAMLLKKVVMSTLKAFDLNGSKAISVIAFYLVFVVVSVMALNQAGVNTEIITNNLFLILGTFLAALAIALGLGSRDVVLRLLLGFYTRKSLPIGKRIKIDEIEGVVLSVDNISLILLKEDRTKLVIPIKHIANKKIQILD